MEEIWEPIKGYEGIYEVSNKGRVKSLDREVWKNGNRNSFYKTTIKGRILKPKLTNFGYYEHGLSNGKKRDMSHFRVNRLVAEAFIENPENKPQVHHIDHNKLNNCVDNLVWATAKENVQAAFTAGVAKGGFKKGKQHHCGKLSDTEVLEIRKIGNSISRKELAKNFNISLPHLCDILNNKVRLIPINFCNQVAFNEGIYPKSFNL